MASYIAMQIYTDLRQLNLAGPTALTIGNFDGVHLGHQALLQTVRQVARDLPGGQGSSALVTFEPHPLKVLRPNMHLDLLTTPRERLSLAGAVGIDIGIIQPFTRELAALEPYDFLLLLKERLAMNALVVGPDFALGRDRSGTLDVLAELGNDLGYRLVVQELFARDKHSVRSRTIRELITDGDVASAALLLGRPYHMAGSVEMGDQRGHQFGIPTANVSVGKDKLWPSDGVYATRSWVPDEGRSYSSVTNIGVRPTVNGQSRRIESHLLDFPTGGGSGDLYGQQLVVEFFQRLRGEKKFSGPEELVAQIRADIEYARNILQDVPSPSEPAFLNSLAPQSAPDA